MGNNSAMAKDGWANYLDELPIWSAPFGLKLLDYIDYRQDITALDVGFGTGFPLIEIASRLGKGSTVYGIDPWVEVMQRVRDKLEFYKVENVNIIVGEAENIPLEDKTIDLITSNNGINNASSIEKVISECARVLKPNGQFIQTMNLDKSMYEFYNVLEEVLAELGFNNEITLMYDHIVEKRPPVDQFLSIMSKHRFVIKDLEYDQFNYKFASGTAFMNHYFIRLAFMKSWEKFLPADQSEKIFKLVENKLNAQAEKLGGLKISIPYVLINAVLHDNF